MSAVGLRVVESGSGEALVLLHGFTGSAETWRPFEDAWPGRRLLAFDLPGHGRPLGRDASIPATIDALLASMDAQGIGRFSLLGYSMGGRIALRLALRAPERVEALILESASPGIADAAARAGRVGADRDLADRIERDGVSAFVDDWERLPLWASQAALPEVVRAALREQRLRNDAAGLATSLREAGAGVVRPVLEELGGFAAPTLLIAGALDRTYCDHAGAMAARLPSARSVVIPDAGHAVHLERPEAFGETVGEFLAGLESRR